MVPEARPAATTAPKTPVLPLTVSSLIDIGRLQRELEALEMFLAQAAARQPGQQGLSLPRTTKNLDDMCRENQWNLLDAGHRQVLAAFLKDLRERAPRIHISFTADPSAAFIQKIAAWFRAQVHPLTILQIGLQPTIAAGCIVRTNNKYFDLSIRNHFDKSRSLLTDKIKQTRQDVRAGLQADAAAAHAAAAVQAATAVPVPPLAPTATTPVQQPVAASPAPLAAAQPTEAHHV